MGIRTAGDDYKAVFVSPAGAVACCLDMMRLLADYNKDLDEAHDQIRIGIGLAYGSFLRLGPPECNVYGAVPDVATDLGEELATPGRSLLTATCLPCSLLPTRVSLALTSSTSRLMPPMSSYRCKHKLAKK